MTNRFESQLRQHLEGLNELPVADREQVENAVEAGQARSLHRRQFALALSTVAIVSVGIASVAGLRSGRDDSPVLSNDSLAVASSVAPTTPSTAPNTTVDSAADVAMTSTSLLPAPIEVVSELFLPHNQVPIGQESRLYAVPLTRDIGATVTILDGDPSAARVVAEAVAPDISLRANEVYEIVVPAIGESGEFWLALGDYSSDDFIVERIEVCECEKSGPPALLRDVGIEPVMVNSSVERLVATHFRGENIPTTASLQSWQGDTWLTVVQLSSESGEWSIAEHQPLPVGTYRLQFSDEPAAFGVFFGIEE